MRGSPQVKAIHRRGVQHPHLVSDEPLDPTVILDTIGVVGPDAGDSGVRRRGYAHLAGRGGRPGFGPAPVSARAGGDSAARGRGHGRRQLGGSSRAAGLCRGHLARSTSCCTCRGCRVGRCAMSCVPIPGGPGRSACSSAERKPPFMPFHPLPHCSLIPRLGSPGRTRTTHCAIACVPLARGPDVLLHLDFHPMNVLVADGRVSAVLDWANAGIGDPRADLARTASILRFAPLAPGMPRPLESMVRRAFIAGWRRGYREVAGPASGMAPFYAWAGAVMIRDLTPRLGRPDLPWLDLPYLERVRQWADGWREQAGCPVRSP